MSHCKEDKYKKHFECKNCNKTSRIVFGNQVIFCAGLVKKPNPSCDKFRFCIGQLPNKRHATDIMVEELVSMLSNLSTTYLKYLQKHPVTKPEEQRKK